MTLANIDYTFGSVIDDSVEIPVTLGDSLAVQRTISPCNGNYCQFRPIVYSGTAEMVNFEGIISKLYVSAECIQHLLQFNTSTIATRYSGTHTHTHTQWLTNMSKIFNECH